MLELYNKNGYDVITKKAFKHYLSIHMLVFSTYMLFYPLHQLLEEENGIHCRTDLTPSQLPSVPLCGETDKTHGILSITEEKPVIEGFLGGYTKVPKL